MNTNSTLIDAQSTGTTYIGISYPGSLTSDPVWLVIRCMPDSIMYANGTDERNNVWDDRETLNYI
jgi:hypothetical protein